MACLYNPYNLILLSAGGLGNDPEFERDDNALIVVIALANTLSVEGVDG